jgi:hypothetical protein
MRYAKYFDDNGFLPPGGENGLLFTSEYLKLRQLLDEDSMLDYNRVNFALNVYKRQDGNFLVNKKEGWSHDNHTGLVCLSHNIDADYHRKIYYSNFIQRIHPRDILFYLYIRGGITKAIAFPFMFICSISMIISCFQSFKYRRIGGEMIKIYKTDGKLLAWLRFNTVKMPLTKKICDYIIKKKHKGWGHIFETYFGKRHPNTMMAKRLYKDA